METGVKEYVPQTRINGKIELDERIFLMKENMYNLERLAVVYPSGNATAVVFDKMPNIDVNKLNSELLKSWQKKNPNEPEIEQCCFVTIPKNKDAIARVEMFGGEFCANATRGVIALLTKGANYNGKIEVSGASEPLGFKTVDGDITLQMPLPSSKNIMIESAEECEIVRLDGITQLVVTDPSKLPSNKSLEEFLGILIDKYGLNEEPAVGVSVYRSESSSAAFCVWVNSVNTIFNETACGSGTAAIGIALTKQKDIGQKVSVNQPSGETIATTTTIDTKTGYVVDCSISGSVSTIYDGEYKIS